MALEDAAQRACQIDEADAGGDSDPLEAHPLGELAHLAQSGEIVGKGEFVVIVAGNDAAAGESLDADRMLVLLDEELGAKKAARIVAEITGQKKNALYERVLELRRSDAS